MPIIERPQAVVSAIRGFLDKVDATAPAPPAPNGTARLLQFGLRPARARAVAPVGPPHAIPTPIEARIRTTIRILEPIVERYFRADVRHLDRVPDGPTVLVSHHDGGVLPVDAICFGVHWHRHFGFRRPLRVLMHAPLPTS